MGKGRTEQQRTKHGRQKYTGKHYKYSYDGELVPSLIVNYRKSQAASVPFLFFYLFSVAYLNQRHSHPVDCVIFFDKILGLFTAGGNLSARPPVYRALAQAVDVHSSLSRNRRAVPCNESCSLPLRRFLKSMLFALLQMGLFQDAKTGLIHRANQQTYFSYHADIDRTEIYARANSEMKRAAIETSVQQRYKYFFVEGK